MQLPPQLGADALLDKGQYLRAIVQPLEVYPEKSMDEFPQLAELDVENEIPADLEKKYIEQQKQVGYFEGYRAWNFFKTKSNLYTLDQVIDWMKKLKRGENLELPETIDANALIDKQCWNLFQNP